MGLIKADALTWTEEHYRMHPLQDFFHKREAHPGYIVRPYWDVTIDHILPASLGGIDHPRNYIFVSGTLNTSWSNGCLEEKFHILGSKARTFFNFLKQAKAHFAAQMNAWLASVPTAPGAKVLG